MKLILHIGTEKTGTTSIQDFLIKKREALLKEGFFVPFSTLGPYRTGNQRYFPYFAHNDGHQDDFWYSLEGDNASRKRQIFIKKEQFIQECKEVSKMCDAVVVSCEHLSSRLNYPEEIERLQAFCSGIFEEIEIVLYLRDQLSMAISVLSESIKGGNLIHKLPKAKNFKMGNYASLLSLWTNNFPDASFKIRRFDRKKLTGGDVVQDFDSHILSNLTKENGILPGKSYNESLSLTGMALLLRLNSEFQPFIDNKINILRGNLKHFILEHTRDGSKFKPTKDEWKDYRDFFSEGNSNIHSQFFPEEESLFGDSFVEYAEESIDLKEVEINPVIYERIISLLWRQKSFNNRK